MKHILVIVDSVVRRLVLAWLPSMLILYMVRPSENTTDRLLASVQYNNNNNNLSMLFNQQESSKIILESPVYHSKALKYNGQTD